MSRLKKFQVFFLSFALTLLQYNASEINDVRTLRETVLIVIFVRNKEHTLPYFLGLLERLHYPKNRIMLWFRSDHNTDRSVEFLHTWIRNEGEYYHDVNFKFDGGSQFFDDEEGPFHWSDQRFRHVIRLKEEALRAARSLWADYVWFLDSDVFLINNQTLNILIEQKKTLIAPMLESLGAYSNYWCGMNEKFYYLRTEEYLPILERKKLGCFEVPMIHTSVLLDLRREESVSLSFDPSRLKGYDSPPEDDIISFALSAKSHGVKLHILNTEVFGFVMVPMEVNEHLQDDYDQLTSLKVHVLTDYNALPASPHLEDYMRRIEPDKLGFDQAYMINLIRRQERREKMMAAFKELNIDVKIWNAVDGRQLNDSYLKERGIQMLPQYQDPYHKRPLTMGEIGCFLSHYTIWKEVVEQQLRAVIVFEDDIRFQSYFRTKFKKMMSDLKRLEIQWDLVYLGRKRLLEKDEPYVDGSDTVVWVEYSYWTLCYILTLEGAQKLLSGDPLSKLVPVDEYIPIMFDKHPEASWKNAFKNRNLRAFSAAPLLVYPTHYTGETDYISDTEDSQVVRVHTEL